VEGRHDDDVELIVNKLYVWDVPTL